MQKAIVHDWFGVDSSSEFYITPLGDIHLINKNTDEEKLARAVDSIKGDPNHYWIDMGDRGEWINVRDPRFDPEELAEWVKMSDLKDLANVQLNRYLGIMSPVADRCLAMVRGNHEDMIQRFTERDVHSAAVDGIKRAAGFGETKRLSLDYTGWLLLRFYRSDKGERHSVSTVKINVHHGWVGGRKEGGKANALEERIREYDADVCLLGHSHSLQTMVLSVEEIDRRGNIVFRTRYGAQVGTYLGQPRYGKSRGFKPKATGTVGIIIRPCLMDERRIQIITNA